MVSKTRKLRSRRVSNNLNAKQDYVFLGNDKGNLRKFSLIQNEIVLNLGLPTYGYYSNASVSDIGLYSISKTPDNKSLFVGDRIGGFSAINILSGKKIKGFNNNNMVFSVATFDNKFLITCQSERYKESTKSKYGKYR